MVLAVYAGIPFAHWWPFRISRTLFHTSLCCNKSSFLLRMLCKYHVVLYNGGRKGKKRENFSRIEDGQYYPISSVQSAPQWEEVEWQLVSFEGQGKEKERCRKSCCGQQAFFQSNGKPFSPARYCSPWFPARAPAQQREWNKPWLKLTLPGRSASLVEGFVCRLRGPERVCKSSIWVNVCDGYLP